MSPSTGSYVSEICSFEVKRLSKRVGWLLTALCRNWGFRFPSSGRLTFLCVQGFDADGAS
jgi:hypothetical protein